MRAFGPKQLWKHAPTKKLPHPFFLFEFEQNVRPSHSEAARISKQETKRREIFTFM